MKTLRTPRLGGERLGKSKTFTSTYYLFFMREHDIVQSVFEQVARQSHREISKRVRHINFARGEIFELGESSILIAWHKYCKGTAFDQVGVKFRSIRAEVQCMACFQKYHPEGGEIHCPHCGSFGAKILAGEEFYLDSIETDP